MDWGEFLFLTLMIFCVLAVVLGTCVGLVVLSESGL